MSHVANLSRRDFLKASAAATGALVLGCQMGQSANAANAAAAGGHRFQSQRLA